MAKSKFRTKPGRLEAGISPRDGAVLNAGGIRVDSVVYDYSVDGGAVGEYTFGRKLPAGSIVTRVFTDELTEVADANDIDLSAGATALVSTINFLLDAGFNSRALDGPVAGIKVSSDSDIKLTINSTAATGGKIRIFVEYLLPND